MVCQILFPATGSYITQTTHQNEVTMTIYSDLLVLSLSTLVVTIEGSHLPYLRTTGGDTQIVVHQDDNDDDDTSSNCNTVHDPQQCCRTIDTKSQNSCVWCVAGAIPSECMSPSQASLLPPDVFDCAVPGGTDTTTAAAAATPTKTSFHFDSVIFGTTQIYSLVHDNHYDHYDNHHHSSYHTKTTSSTTTAPPQPSKSELCDASSNSLSGYMDISGSEYDKSGENKHLFYWFFEKRGTTDTDVVTDSDTPVRSLL